MFLKPLYFYLFTLLAVGGSLSALSAQGYKAFVWEGAILLGGANYSGDINPTFGPRFKDTRPAIGATGRIPVSPKLGVRTNIAFGGLVGDDLDFEERQDRGFRFNSDVLDMSLMVEYEPLGRDRFYANAKGQLEMDRLISPYVLAGIGFSFINTAPDFSRLANTGLTSKIAADMRKGSSLVTPIVPIGGGIRWDIDMKYSVAFEIAARLTFSDYVDGISQAAGPDSNDTYLISGFMLYYRF